MSELIQAQGSEDAAYTKKLTRELRVWQREMLQQPGYFNGIAHKIQTKINNLIPEKIHEGITAVIRQMIRGVLFGAEFTSTPALTGDLIAMETVAREKIDFYRKNSRSRRGHYRGRGITPWPR